MCSTRWLMPDPAYSPSDAEPEFVKTEKTTIGFLWSSLIMTLRPLSSVTSPYETIDSSFSWAVFRTGQVLSWAFKGAQIKAPKTKNAKTEIIFFTPLQIFDEYLINFK